MCPMCTRFFVGVIFPAMVQKWWTCHDWCLFPRTSGSSVSWDFAWTWFMIYMAPALNSIPAWSRDWWRCMWVGVQFRCSSFAQDCHAGLHWYWCSFAVWAHFAHFSSSGLQRNATAINRSRNSVQSPRHWVQLSFHIQEHLSPELNWRSQTWWICASGMHLLLHTLPDAYTVLAKILAQSVSTRSTFATVALQRSATFPRI